MKVVIFLALVAIFMINITLAYEENIHAKIFEKMKGESPKEQFKIFYYLNKKPYELNSEEGIRRYKIFKATLKEIEAHNSKADKTWEMGVTPYSDTTEEEMGNVNVKSYEYAPKTTNTIQSQTAYAPINWTSKFSTTQFAMSSKCAAQGYIAGASAFEANYNIATGKSINISPQSFLDCSANGCYQFADFIYGYGTFSRIGGFTSSAYRFTGLKATCKNLSGGLMPKYWETTAYGSLTADSAYAALTRGPFIFNSQFTVSSSYKSGIITPTTSITSCGSYYYHLLAVGYGIDATTGKDYWIIRGFLGSSWGESGYLRFFRNDTLNNYGLTCSYSRPVFGSTQ